MSEEDILIKIEKARDGDENSFSWLAASWYQRLYNVGYKYFNDHDLATEVSQKSLITVHEKIDQLQHPSAFSSWIYRIALNHCREEDRKRKRRNWISIFRKDQESDDRHFEVGKYHPDKEIQTSELQRVLGEALSHIPAEQKEILIMKEYEGLKFREIAEILKISENTVKSRLYYGLKAMKKILEKWNVNLEEVYYEN